jgi:purine-binding chemotaxis protein CheW
MQGSQRLYTSGVSEMTVLISKKPVNAATPPSRQVLTFCLGTESYGVDILRVQEIRGWSPVTRIPKSPDHVLGVLNLRGSIVPIVDLRVHLNLERVEFTAITVIIVLSVVTAAGRSEFGLVVDSVSDVVDINVGDMKETPNLGGQLNSDFIQCLATVADRMLILLDVDALLGHEKPLGDTNILAGAA